MRSRRGFTLIELFIAMAIVLVLAAIIYPLLMDVTGDVESVTFLETQLRSDFNELISIPNATILNSEVKNFSRTGGTTTIAWYTWVTSARE